MKDLKTPLEAMTECKYIASLVRAGAISYIEGKRASRPLLETVNNRGEQIARKHKVKYKKITYTGLLR